jgi:hypothetical protein
MPFPSNSDPKAAEEARKATSIGLNVFSKVLAILVLSFLPIAAGYYLDLCLGWRCFVFVGILFSVVIAMGGLLGIAKQANLELVKNAKKR